MPMFDVKIRTLAEITVNIKMHGPNAQAVLKAAKNKMEQTSMEALEDYNWEVTHFPFEHRPRVVQVWGDGDLLGCKEDGL